MPQHGSGLRPQRPAAPERLQQPRAPCPGTQPLASWRERDAPRRMFRAWRRYGSLRGHQTWFDRNQPIAERSRVSVQKIGEAAGGQTAIAREREQRRQTGGVPQHLRDDAADANLSVHIAHALKIVTNIEIRG